MTADVKILQVVFGLGLGGVERTAQNCALATQALGYETTVLAFEDGPRADFLREAGISVIIDSNLAGIPKQDFIALHSHGLIREQVDALLRNHPEAIVCEKNVFSRPSPWMDHVDISVQLSPWAHWLYGQRGGDLRRSSTHCNPVDPSNFWRDRQRAHEFRREHRIPLEATVLGRIGQPLSMKWSPRVYAKVCQEISRDRSLHLLLVGAPPEIVSIVAANVPSGQYTTIESLHNDVDLRAAYSAMDLFVHAARQGESFGNVIAESALCEVPTLTIATPWADNSQGYVAGPGGFVASSVQGLVSALRQAISNRDDLVQRGRISREFVLENFAATPAIKQILEVAAGDRPRRPIPTQRELHADAYLGNNPGRLASALALTKRSLILGATTGQESWRWAFTVQLNSWGLSRRGYARPQQR